MRLIASDLTCQRGGRIVLNGLDLEVETGEALLVTGPNGAGKSTLLRALAGLLRPTAGAIALHGGDPELSVAEQCHFLGHLDPVKPTLTVSENLHFWVGFLGGKPDVFERHPFDVVGLRDVGDLPAGYLSAGQRRRLSLARLIAVERPVWLLDEPTSALDAAGQAMFTEQAQAHVRRGGLIVAATHAPLGFDRARQLQLGELE